MQITTMLPNPTIAELARVYNAARNENLLAMKPWTKRIELCEAAMLRRLERERDADSTAYHMPASPSLVCLVSRMIDVLGA
jgi:hypothetical protein